MIDTFNLIVTLEPINTDERSNLVQLICGMRGVKTVKVNAPQVEAKPDTSLMSIIRSAVYTCCEKSDWQTWRKLEIALNQPGVMLSQDEHSILVRGLGMKAAWFQERYAPSISRALVGIFDHPASRIAFME
jgi:hypothetical protein